MEHLPLPHIPTLVTAPLPSTLVTMHACMQSELDEKAELVVALSNELEGRQRQYEETAR